MKVALVGGTGGLGPGLAARLTLADVEVVIGSRSREKAERVAREVSELIGAAVKYGENPEAVRDSDVVVLTIPYEAVEPTLKSLSHILHGKTVISPIVSPNPAPGNSAAEKVRSLTPEDSKVAAALHNVGAHRLLDLQRPLDCDVLVCGEDDAKKTAVELVEKIPGLRAIDGGGLQDSWIPEAITHLLIRLNKRYKRKSIGIRFTGI